MIKKILTVIATVVLVLIPFVPITENFYLLVDQTNFKDYLLVCSIIGMVMLLLALFTNYRNSVHATNKTILTGTWLLAALGFVVLVPLHFGAPKNGQALLDSATVEHIRYAFLLLAVALLAAGVITLLKPFWSNLVLWEKTIVLPLILVILISVWDYGDSFTFSSQLTAWINSGKRIDDFSPNYNFHENWRAAGRILLYVVAVWLVIIISRKSIIKKWSGATIIIFSLIGIGFCVTCVIKGMAFYFPFMVPAIAMAPAFWLGIALLHNTSIKSVQNN